jgi:endonuclease III
MEKLIQEDFWGQKWEMVVICILLNQTSNKQVRKILDDLFKKIKNPSHCSRINPEDIEGIIKPTGLSKIKSRRIVLMSQKWVSGFSHPLELPGVGKYALESWEIFINRNYDIVPTDKKLKKFLMDLEGINHLN